MLRFSDSYIFLGSRERSGGGVGVWPSVVMEMIPAHKQGHTHDFSRAGAPCTNKSGLPGIHGAWVLGIQGMGVSTPIAADVAAATVGLASERHSPNGAMLTSGLWSVILAIGLPVRSTVLMGNTVSIDGLMPIEHFSRAVEQT